jgi:CRP/FNR family cyclic AMP-dependent transcriptional regulator
VRRRQTEQRSVLASVPLFASLPPRHLRRLAEVTAVTNFDEGDDIVREGASGSVLYVIAEGEAKVVRAGRTIARLKPGQFFGELSVLAGTPRTASVVAAMPTRCVTMSSRNLRTVLLDEPAIAVRILEHVAGRLAAAERPPAG